MAQFNKMKFKRDKYQVLHIGDKTQRYIYRMVRGWGNRNLNNSDKVRLTVRAE